MAHDPKLKAKVLKDWATGKFSERELSKKYGVSFSTIGTWVRPKNAQNRANLNPKVNRYMDALERFGVAAMDMLTSHAELWGDKDFLRNQAPDDATKQRESILSQLERFVRLHRPLPSAPEHDSLPERGETGGEVLIPDVVEEDPA